MRFFKRFFGRSTESEPSENREINLLNAKELEHVVGALARSFFKEREHADRRRFWKRFLFVSLIILGSVFYIGSEKNTKVDDMPYAKKFAGVTSGAGTGKVFFIKLEGAIGGGYFADQDQGNTVVYIKEALESALEEKHLAGIVLNIDSPGGGASASAQIYRLLKKFKREHPTIPLYSYVSGGAYSGAYYSAIGTEWIIADPQATVGNIGVIWSVFNTSKFGEHIGVRQEVVATGPNKGIGEQWRKISKENRKMIKADIDVQFRMFVEAVSESRRIELADLERETNETFGRTSGAWFAAEIALKKHLIDEIIPAEDFFPTYAPKFAEKNKFKEIEYIRYQPKAALADKVSRRASLAGRAFFHGFIEAMKKDGDLRMERE